MVAVLVCAMSVETLAGNIQRPNIVIIMCDDLGYADVGFNGAKDIKTPALDALAHGGTICTSGYVAHPFCGPSRMGLMTGRYPHRFGAPFNLPNSGQGIEEYNRQGIPENETLISTMLQGAGYYTGAIGKWHMGIDPQFHPNARGFDDFYGFLGGGHMYFPDKYNDIYERQVKAGKTTFNEYQTPLEHNGQNVRETEYMTDALSREASRFVTEAAEMKKPFFLYLAYNAPHTPLEAKEDDLALYAGIDDEKRRAYAAMVHAVDRGVGRLVETLKTSGAFDNTLIVFLSDNGGQLGAGASNEPLTQGKGSVCEGGFRVPMFFHWPAEVAAGRHFDHPVTALDFYPTFARLARATVSADRPLDGKDIWDAFQADRSPRADEPIYALRHWNGFHNVGIRRDQWKATKQGPNSAWSLFNIEEDISESNDVSSQHPELVEQMVDDARAWSESHTRPRWFDSKEAEDSWTQNGMPKYKLTFASTTAVTAATTTTNSTAAVEEHQPFGDVNSPASKWNFIAGQSDEFDGDEINREKWNTDTKDFGPWSWEPENVTQKAGSMHLQMTQQDHQRDKQTLHYTSGMARNDKTITYGYFEARVKGCSRYPGASPAFWLYSIGPEHRFGAQDGETVAYSEIDVIELQQSEFDFETKTHFPVNRIDCNLHSTLLKDGKREWVRPNNRPDLCKNHFDSEWDPREDYHIYAAENSHDWIVWYIDGKEVARKKNLYWHLPMHVTLSLGLRYPFVGYKNGERFAVPEKTTADGFPTTMSVDYVRVWQRTEVSSGTTPTKKLPTDWTMDEFVAKEKAKWAANGWNWNQEKVESNFAEIDANKNGIASGKERQDWYEKQAAKKKASK